MRKVIVCNMMSLDGYYEGPGKNVMSLFDYRRTYPSDESFDVYNAERLRAADTLLLGHVSYNGFRSYWPEVVNDHSATRTARAISRLNNAIRKVVISDTLTAQQTDPWRTTTSIVTRADARKEVARLKRQQGKEILIFGSRVLWNDLLAGGLVDELHLMISPVVLGAGTQLFDSHPALSLRRVGTRTWKNSATVLIRYAVAGVAS